MAQVREKIDFDDGIEYAVPADRRPSGGVVIRRDPLTGADVFMYKRRPGTFYSGHGTEVAPAMAERAGFDVKYLTGERERMLAQARFEVEWRQKNAGAEVKRIREFNGYALDFHPGTGYYVVHIESGDNMTKTARAKSEQEGLDWLASFAGPLPPQEFDGTPESVKVVDGDIQRASDEGRSRTDRRPRPDAGSDRNLRSAGNS